VLAHRKSLIGFHGFGACSSEQQQQQQRREVPSSMTDEYLMVD